MTGIDENRPTYIIDHGNSSYDDVVFERLKLMTNLKKELGMTCPCRTQVLQMVGQLDPPREYYDQVLSSAIFEHLKGIPFRKDLPGVETIQYPDYTVKYGGDCDDLSLCFAVYCWSAGIDTKWIISKQNFNHYDHVAVFVPGIGVADLTFPQKVYPLPLKLYRDFKIV